RFWGLFWRWALCCSPPPTFLRGGRRRSIPSRPCDTNGIQDSASPCGASFRKRSIGGLITRLQRHINIPLNIRVQAHTPLIFLPGPARVPQDRVNGAQLQ